jgi:hypothetical protein
MAAALAASPWPCFPGPPELIANRTVSPLIVAAAICSAEGFFAFSGVAAIMGPSAGPGASDLEQPKEAHVSKAVSNDVTGAYFMGGG